MYAGILFYISGHFCSRRFACLPNEFIGSCELLVCTYVHCHCYEVPANFRTPIDISGKHRQWYMQSCRLNQSVKIHLFVCRWKILVDSACIFLLLYLIKSNFLTTHQCRVVDATPSGVSKLAVYGCALPFFQHLMGLPLRNFWQKKIHRVMSGHRTMT